jgi:hypothetical protein
MALASQVHDIIEAVCLLDGCSGPYGVPQGTPVNTDTSISWNGWAALYPAKDGSYWRLDFDPAATAAQQTAAIRLLASTDTTLILPVYTAQLWQLQAVMSAPGWTGPTWAQVTTAVQASGNATAIAFFSHPGNRVRSNSTTLLALGKGLGMTAAQINALVQQASQIALP